MVTKDLVVTWMNQNLLFGYEWVAGYFASVAEAYRSHAMKPNLLPDSVQVVIRQIKMMPGNPADDTIQETLFETLEDGALVFDRPQTVLAIQFPARPPSLTAEQALAQKRQLLLTQYAGKLNRLKHARTVSQIVRGELFADAAKALGGWFHWVSAGPEPGPERRFFPRERSTKDETETAEYVEVKDDFSFWLNRGGKEPGIVSNMNCWEAVFFAAYKAGLISVQGLRVIHAKATLAGRDSKNSQAYFDKLMEALHYPGSFPLVPEIGLLPIPGDVVFVAGEHHVTVCADLLAVPDWRDSVEVMSLWKFPGDGFMQIAVNEFGSLIDDLTFAPCPF